MVVVWFNAKAPRRQDAKRCRHVFVRYLFFATINSTEKCLGKKRVECWIFEVHDANRKCTEVIHRQHMRIPRMIWFFLLPAAFAVAFVFLGPILGDPTYRFRHKSEHYYQD